MQRFDRFPDLDGLSPDFVAYFGTPYILCGEYMKSFRSGAQGKKDAKQVISYSRWAPPEIDDGVPPSYDVLLLTGTHSDDVAAKELQAAAASGDPKLQPKAPIVIVGFFRDVERINDEWYDLKWREMPGNSRFSEPNVTPHRDADDLNSLITAQPRYPIRVDRSAIDLSGRNPLINDDPPPLYTFIRVVFPAINELLTDDERDCLRTQGRVEKLVSRDDILGAPILREVAPPQRYIQKALDWLTVSGLARRVKEPDTPKYAIKIDTDLIRKELVEVMSLKGARAMIRKLKSTRRGKGKKGKEAARQLKLFDV